MFPKTFSAAVALTSTALAVPYAVAFITELLYGKSSKSYNRYLRALHPYRVYALNVALFSTLSRLKYAKLYLKWTKHYRSISIERVVKDISFGQNQNSLDIYKPLTLRGKLDDYRLKPIVVFLYGGTWGSGDKNMYSLLCSEIADNFNCLVVCPNYSTYPKGFVDDMVRDVSDALQWVKSNAVLYGGDSSRIAIIGHSAGGHLAALTVLELYLKCLQTSPESLELADPPKDNLPMKFNFARASTFVRDVGNRTFEARQAVKSEILSKEEDLDAKISEEVQRIQAEKDESREENGSESFVLVNPNEGSKSGEDSPKKEKVDVQPLDVDDVQSLNVDDVQSLNVDKLQSLNVDDVQSLESKGEPKQQVEHVKVDKDCNLLKSIKVVIGLAGVYDIKKHYEHETTRAIENYSTMGRAMYDDDNNFDNFSPSLVLNNIPPHVKLPPFHLMHGICDDTVPATSSISFADVLNKRGGSDAVNLTLFKCDHVDICLDLMDEDRRLYGAVMNEIKKTFREFLL